MLLNANKVMVIMQC